MSNHEDGQVTQSIHWQIGIGASLAFLLVVGLGGWSVVTAIESAVIAPGTVVVEGARKAVQHDTGGIVKQINVKDGDHVEAGAVLILLDGAQIAAEIAATEKRIFDYKVRIHRLSAERLGHDAIVLPKSMREDVLASDELAELVAVQKQLLQSRLGLRKSKRQQLQGRIEQLRQEIVGLTEVRRATEEEMAIYRLEVENLKGLRGEGLVNVARYNQLRRNAAEKRGRLGQTIADIARAESRIIETRQQIEELDVTALNEVLKEHETIEGELTQLSERLRAALARQARLEIRASDRGTIHELVVHTVGGVIKAGDTVASIVPSDTKLVVDANVQTIDRDQVWSGMPARVRFTAFNQRTTPELSGTIERIASDQSGGTDNVAPYYGVRIALAPDQVARLGSAEVKPGMPAEVMMTAGPRTVLSYLTKPLTDQFNRAFRDE
ncbi:MAG: HlyD family type I secretion periplasmic adaptor subunit [Hyphomicrobiaceae bacterium]